MKKVERIKKFLINKYGLHSDHFNVNIEKVAGGSREYKSAISDSDISGVNRLFEGLVHEVRLGENWCGIKLIASSGVAEALIQDLNSFFEEIDEEPIELTDDSYKSISEGLCNFMVEKKVGKILISLSWRIN